MAPTGLSNGYAFQKVGDRYYDPVLMCFLTRDTELDQLPYTYCGGEPVNRNDPSGHFIQWVVIGFAVLAIYLLHKAITAKPAGGRPTNHSPLWQ